jgi:nucleoside-diphosphate-sugar epimerase
VSAVQVLVTGAAGVLGTRLCGRLLQAGHRVRALVLANDPGRAQLQQLGVEVREGDIRDPSSLAGLCDGIDVVYHLAAIIIAHDPGLFPSINRDGTAHVLAEADSARVHHFVYVSSASVTYPKLTPYAQSKLQAERLVRARSGAFTIVRPTLVYDERGGLELHMFRKYLERFPIVPFVGAGHARKRPVWSEDIVTGLALLCGNAAALGKSYNFSGAEAISMRDFARLILRHDHRERPLLHLPVPLCRAIARGLALCMAEPPLTLSAIAGIVNDADLDPSAAMRELGYRPIGVRAGFARCFPLTAGIARLDQEIKAP